MLSGLPPFYSENTNEMYQKARLLFPSLCRPCALQLTLFFRVSVSSLRAQILSDPLRFGDEISPDARSLLTGLLTRDPQQRLGVTGAESIKSHPFFAKHIDFKKLMQKKIQPPFKPNVESAADTSNVRTPPLLSIPPRS